MTTIGVARKNSTPKDGHKLVNYLLKLIGIIVLVFKEGLRSVPPKIIREAIK
jgi:hypothetical protein